jgi:hypothetical protein
VWERDREKSIFCKGVLSQTSLTGLTSQDLPDLQSWFSKSLKSVRAILLATQKNLSAYEACYAVLARQLNISLITADKPMVQAVEWSVWLGDFK